MGHLKAQQKGLPCQRRASLKGKEAAPPPQKSWPVRPDTGSLTGDAARHVHSHGDSKAKTQVDTKKAPKLLLSQNHMSHGTKTKYL